MIFGAPVSLMFSLRPPAVYPFPKKIEVINAKKVAVEPSVGIPPPLFLQEISLPSSFNIHIGIGLPDNDSFSTLSYQDFYSPSSGRNLNGSSSNSKISTFL